MNTEPLIVSVPERLLREMQDVVNTACENASALLADYDVTLGRTTRKNRAIAKMYEEDVAKAISARATLVKLIGENPTTP